MAGYQPENHFFYSPMTCNYDFCSKDNARRFQPAGHRFSLTAPQVSPPLIGVTFTSIP